MFKNKLLLLLTASIVSASIFADSLFDKPLDKDPKKQQQAAMQIESTFAPTISQVTLVKTDNKINWDNSGLTVNINNQWQIAIKSKDPIHVEKIKIGIDNDAIENHVNIDVKPGTAAKYLFTADTFQNNIKQIIEGQTILGIVHDLNIDDYHGYKWYSFKKFNVTITYTQQVQNQTIYNETSTIFIMVLGK